MNSLESDLSKREYLIQLKGCFDNPFLLWNERVCGFIIGPFFSVAYHCEYEWNRRITSECNRAWGWVKDADGKTEVKFIRGKGMLSPFWMLFLILVCAIILFISVGATPVPLTAEDAAYVWFASITCSLIICGVSALASSMTEAGQEGAGEITRMLRNPRDYFC